MSVSAVSNNTTTPSTDVAGAVSQALGKMDFLKLLVTQLQNLDPMSPMDDTQSVAQLAQFSSLEEMQNLNSSFNTYASSATATQAYGLIGKWVDYNDATTGQTLTGRVNNVSFANGQPKLAIGDASVD